MLKFSHSGVVFILACLCGSLPQTALSADASSKLRIQQMYVAYYGRPGDPGGIDFWADQLEQSGGNLSVIIDAFATSEEFTKRFGTLTNEQLVNNLYKQMFGRDAETAGLDWWTGQINSGDTTLASAAIQIADGAQNEDLQTLTNRTEVSQKFTDELAASGKQFSLSNVDSARNMMLTVNAETDPTVFGVKKSVSVLASGTMTMNVANLTADNQQTLGVAAARGIKKAIVNQTKTNAKTSGGQSGNNAQTGASATGIIYEDSFCTQGDAAIFHEDDYSYSSYSYTDCHDEDNESILSGREEWWYSEDALSDRVKYTDFYFYDLYDDSWYWFNGEISTEWSENYTESFAEYNDFDYEDSWGDSYYVAYAQEWCTYGDVTLDDDGQLDEASDETCEWFEPEFVDPYTGETYMIEDEEVTTAGEDTYAASAKVYEERNGYVQAKTLQPVSVACSNGALTGGTIEFWTAEGNTGVLTLSSCESFSITLGDETQHYNWADVKQVGQE